MRKKLWIVFAVMLVGLYFGGIDGYAEDLSNDGKPIDSPYGDSGLPSSFDTGEYYDCAVPYATTIEEIGGYANGVICDPHGYGAMPVGREKNIPGYWFNYEGDFIGSGSFGNLVSRAKGSKGVSSYEDTTGASIITVNDVDFYITAVQPFFYNCDKADNDGFAGCSELGQTNVDPVGRLIDVILTDGTCIHYICGDINSINHTNGGPAESPFREVQWTFTEMKYPQYKNLFSAAGGNTLEVWGKSGCSSKLASKFNLGSGDDENHVAYYRMYNLSVNDDFNAVSDEAKEVSYNVGDIDTSGVKEEEEHKASDGSTIAILNEWELPGMPSKSSLDKGLTLRVFVDRSSLSISETRNLASLNESLELQKQLNLWQNIRVAGAFTGLLLITYAVILFLCMLFDIFNNFVDISLVNIMTFGVVHYNSEAESGISYEGTYIGTKRLVVGIAVVFAVGCMLVSGSIIPAVLRFIYVIVDKVVR